MTCGQIVVLWPDHGEVSRPHSEIAARSVVPRPSQAASLPGRSRPYCRQAASRPCRRQASRRGSAAASLPHRKVVARPRCRLAAAILASRLCRGQAESCRSRGTVALRCCRRLVVKREEGKTQQPGCASNDSSSQREGEGKRREEKWKRGQQQREAEGKQQ